MRRPLIIGYGNPLREDDGIGWRAAELLERALTPEAADVVRCHQLTPELAVQIERASMVIFLDAAVDQQPGCICITHVAAGASTAWSHHLAPRQLLGLVDQAPPAYSITWGVASTEWREGLTDEGETGARRLAAEALSLLPGHTQHAGAAANRTSSPVLLR